MNPQELSQNERVNIALIMLWLRSGRENTPANVRLTMESYDSAEGAVFDATYFRFGLPSEYCPAFDRASLLKAFEHVRANFDAFFPE